MRSFTCLTDRNDHSFACDGLCCYTQIFPVLTLFSLTQLVKECSKDISSLVELVLNDTHITNASFSLCDVRNDFSDIVGTYVGSIKS